jgi:YgiT-type zinc finger domain-containing protein
MKCMYCNGKMERKPAPFHVDKKDYHLQLDAVPAWVCTQCGEIYFEEGDVEAIQAVIDSVDSGMPTLAKFA